MTDLISYLKQHKKNYCIYHEQVKAGEYLIKIKIDCEVDKFIIGFSKCENMVSCDKVVIITKKPLSLKGNNVIEVVDTEMKVNKMYDIIYNMDKREMLIELGDIDEEVCLNELPASIYPLIAWFNEGEKIQIVETYYRCVRKAESLIIGITKKPRTESEDIKEYVKQTIDYLLDVLKNKKECNTDEIKNNISSKFKLDKKIKKYLAKSDVSDLIILLKYLLVENEDYLNPPDSFVRIVNNLKIVDRNKLVIDEDGMFVENHEIKKYLDFTEANVQVFQFPKNLIYIRDCYYTMFSDICKLITDIGDNSNIIITGQPGIGKTSFIYVLLFFLKNNLSYQFNPKEANYLKREYLKEEMNNIRGFLNEFNNEKAKEKQPLQSEKEELENKIKHSDEKINGYYKDIEKEIDRYKTIGKDSDEDLYTKEEKSSKYILKIFDKEIVIIGNNKAVMDSRGRYGLNIEKVNKKLTDENIFPLLEVFESENSIICKRVITDRILVRCDNIDSEKTSKSIYENRIIEIENKIKIIEDRYNDMKTDLPKKLKEIEDNVDKIKDVSEVDINALGVGFNYYIFEACKKIKNIYFIKGKKDGNADETRIYKLENVDGNFILFKSAIAPGYIHDSLIIVDTHNYKFDGSNIIISISSPDKNNNDVYNINNSEELFFDSLDNTEIVEWFKHCVGFNVNVDGNEFKGICKKYGYTPRQIYYHYLYKENHNGDYWEYYKQLIESVVGTTSYIQFVENYMKQEKLKENQLSNIILKYDLVSEWDDEVKHKILKPKKYLKFISEDVERYIVYKFNPPQNKEEYQQIEKYYSLSKDDVNMRRMGLKQIMTYELSTGMIMLKYQDSSGSDIIIKDPNFKINSELYIPAYHPPKALHSVFYILDENNYFDLIMNGVFIKILLDNEGYNKVEKIEKIKESIKKYSKKKNCVFKCCIIQNNKLYPFDMDMRDLSQVVVEGEGEEVEDDEQLQQQEQQLLLPQPTVDPNMKVYIKSNSIYLMRDCYERMLNRIISDINNPQYNHQRNYLIFGHAKIGKTILANIIKEKIIINCPNVDVIHLFDIGKPSLQDEDYDNKRNPIVISDGIVIGEDDYANAKMIILLANPSKEEYKTFQSKRCPSIMYIPQFTKEEVEKVVSLRDPTLDKSHNGFTMYGSVTKIEEDRINNYKKMINKYKMKYPIYKGVIGYYDQKEENFEIDFRSTIGKEENKRMIWEIIKGIDKSPFSKGKYDNILIYDTYEDGNGIFKSNHLTFISEEIKKMACEILYEINDKGSIVGLL